MATRSFKRIRLHPTHNTSRFDFYLLEISSPGELALQQRNIQSSLSVPGSKICNAERATAMLAVVVDVVENVTIVPWQRNHEIGGDAECTVV